MDRFRKSIPGISAHKKCEFASLQSIIHFPIIVAQFFERHCKSNRNRFPRLKQDLPIGFQLLDRPRPLGHYVLHVALDDLLAFTIAAVRDGHRDTDRVLCCFHLQTAVRKCRIAQAIAERIHGFKRRVQIFRGEFRLPARPSRGNVIIVQRALPRCDTERLSSTWRSDSPLHREYPRSRSRLRSPDATPPGWQAPVPQWSGSPAACR